MAKKKEKSVLPMLVGAIGFGIAAALLSTLYLKSREAAIRASLIGPEVQEVKVVVANKMLPKGSPISANDFALRAIPSNFVHSDVVYPGEFELFIGRSLTENLGDGNTLLKSFMDESFPIDFSDTIPEGHRAITVSVDEVNSFSGHLRPGNRIDLFVNIPYGESGFNAKAVVDGLVDELPSDIKGISMADLSDFDPDIAAELLSTATPSDVILPVVQNVRILATGKEPYIESLDKLRQPQPRKGASITTVTLDVSATDAVLIAAAEDKGELLALLRNRKDKTLADFASLSTRDLFENAKLMAEQAKLQQAAALIATGVDENGNLVNANGDTIMTKEQLAAAGLTINENGEIVDANGNVIDPRDVIVGKDGKVMTRQQLAAAGLSVNENGEIVDKDGNVVDPNDVIVTADGRVLTKAQLAAAGLTINANGEIVDASGKVVDPNDIIITADGTAITKQQLAAAGLSVNENGEIVDKDGNVISSDDLLVASDGSVISKQELAKAGLRLNENGEIVDKDGNVVSGEQLAAKLGRPELANATGFKSAKDRAASSVVASLPGESKSVDLIIGGASEDGVAKVTELPVEEDDEK